MPTVAEAGGFRIRVFGPPREHPPVHVHVEFGIEGLVVIRLRTKVKPQAVWAVYGMKDRNVITAYRLVEKYESAIRMAWGNMHD